MKAIYLDEAIERFTEAGQNMSKDQVIYMLNRIPTTEIVKCKECKRVEKRSCPYYAMGLGYTDYDFCSYGKRREDK